VRDVVAVDLLDLYEGVSHSLQRVGIIVGLDHFERVECGEAGEKADELCKTKVVSPQLGFALEGCRCHCPPPFNEGGRGFPVGHPAHCGEPLDL